MSVYFVYRSHYEGPSGKHVRVLDGDSVLGWFQSVWERAKGAEDVSGWLQVNSAPRSTASPRSSRPHGRVAAAAHEPTGSSSPTWRSTSTSRARSCQPHALQVLTDDDEIELAYFFFDDHYLEANPAGPPTCSTGTGGCRPRAETACTSRASRRRRSCPPGRGPGATYLAFLAFSDSLNLTDLDVDGPCRIEGVRLPQLAEYLRTPGPMRPGHWS